MNNPEISVIIPVYKVEKYIRECLESIIAQTMREIEIVVVNDGSPDRSADIAREYAAADHRIKIIDQHNQGLSAARNAGLKAASAPLVMFVDSDDTVDPDYCRTMFDALTDDADAAVCWLKFDYEDGIAPDPQRESRYRFNSDDTKRCNVVVCNKIFRIDIIRRHGIEFPVGLQHEDIFFWNAYLPWCRKMSVVTEYLYHYRIRKDSIMGPIIRGKRAISPDYLRVIAELADYYDRNGLIHDDEWGKHFWRVFDTHVRVAQRYRPERFKSERGVFRKIKRFFIRTLSGKVGKNSRKL